MISYLFSELTAYAHFNAQETLNWTSRQIYLLDKRKEENSVLSYDSEDGNFHEKVCYSVNNAQDNANTGVNVLKRQNSSEIPFTVAAKPNDNPKSVPTKSVNIPGRQTTFGFAPPPHPFATKSIQMVAGPRQTGTDLQEWGQMNSQKGEASLKIKNDIVFFDSEDEENHDGNDISDDDVQYLATSRSNTTAGRGDIVALPIHVTPMIDFSDNSTSTPKYRGRQRNAANAPRRAIPISAACNTDSYETRTDYQEWEEMNSQKSSSSKRVKFAD
jgi:hypothetical protein